MSIITITLLISLILPIIIIIISIVITKKQFQIERNYPHSNAVSTLKHQEIRPNFHYKYSFSTAATQGNRRSFLKI